MEKMKLDIQRFTTNMSVGDSYTQAWQSGNSVGGTSGAFKWRIVVNYSSRNINNNTSTIRIRFQEYGTWGSYSGMNSTYSRLKISLNNGSSYTQLAYSKTPSYDKGETETKLDVNYTITHNADGSSPSIKIQASNETTNTATYAPANKTITSDTIVLATIPRASEITSVTSGTTDYSPTVIWTPASNTFTFKVGYTFGQWSYLSDLISPASTSEQTFNSYQITGANLAQYMTGATGTFTATLYTYQSDGTTLIGSKTKTFTVTLADSYKPTVTYGSVTDVGGIVPSGWGVLVQGKSKLSFAISATASTGSTIASYNTVVENIPYTTANVTTAFLQNAGQSSFTPTAIDSRDRVGTATAYSYTVQPYDEPAITTVFADRCLSDGTLDDSGTYLKYSFACTYSTCSNKNQLTCKLWYKLKTDASYTNSVTINNNSTNVVLPGVTFSASFPYDIKFEATDSFGAVASEHIDLRTGFKLVHYNKNKQAIAIGKTSEATTNQKLLEVALPTNIAADVSVTGNVSATGNIIASGNLSGGLANALKTNILNYMYPVGTTYVTKTNVNPGTFLGGNWQIYDKKLKSQIIVVNDATSSTYFTKATANCNSSDFRFDIADHFITIDFRIGNKILLNDTAYTMGTFNFSQFSKCFDPYDASTNPTGSDYTHAHYTTAYTDGGNSLVMTQITNAGVLQTLDCKPNTVAAGNTVQGCFVVGSYWGDLIDSACDQFYWERKS